MGKLFIKLDGGPAHGKTVGTMKPPPAVVRIPWPSKGEPTHRLVYRYVVGRNRYLFQKQEIESGDPPEQLKAEDNEGTPENHQC